MEVLFIEYPKCSTCKKAKKWLEENNILYSDRNIIENKPTKAELKKWIKTSNLDIKKWFNTSGMKYRELDLKEKLIDMSDEDKIDLLSSDGMLIKRPLLVTNKFILTGFREKEWKEKFNK
ncbi:MAG: arsenate reductase family protein [Clostridia bacterium]|nr:arsenate reductase family protein [Clostridia bacterium]